MVELERNGDMRHDARAIASICARDMISRLPSRSPTAPRSARMISKACSTLCNFTSASAELRGGANSFSTAAVMMPSVPSAPMKSCFRS